MKVLLRELYVVVCRPSRYASTPTLVLSLVMVALSVVGMVANFPTGHWVVGLIFLAVGLVYTRLAIAFWPWRK